MNRTTTVIFNALIRAARPASLLVGILLYALGGGIAVYLGNLIDWAAYWLGQAAVTLLQMSSYLLREYFDRAGQPPFSREGDIARRKMREDFAAQDSLTGKGAEKGGEQEELPIIVPRVIFLQVSLTALTAATVLTVLLYARGDLSPAAFLFVGLAVLLVVLYAVPPFRLVYSGYGELIIAILTTNLFPALAFLFQAGELHRLLPLMTLPLTFLYLATMLARSLQTYLEDQKTNRQTMMTRLGWQRGIVLHNILIAAAYITLSAAVIAGLPWQLAFPAFLSLPIAALQIWQINSISGGAKPRWRLLAVNAMATLGFAAYFMNLALWTS